MVFDVFSGYMVRTLMKKLRQRRTRLDLDGIEFAFFSHYARGTRE